MRDYLLSGGPRDGERIGAPPGPVPLGALCKTAIDMAGYRPLARLGALEILAWSRPPHGDCSTAPGAVECQSG